MENKAKWSGGLAEWRRDDTLFLSVVFTWQLPEAHRRAIFARAQGLDVVAGGPALFLEKNKRQLYGAATIQTTTPDAIRRHNPLATIASRGCPVNCSFCIVPAMEGREFTLLPDFIPRPILCDNNLSGLPGEYQDHIIEKYTKTETPIIDANSGYEPQTFTTEVYRRWRKIINAGRGPWRFAFDETAERADVERILKMLSAEPQRRKRVYVLIGNEPLEDCLSRINTVIKLGGEPYAQPVMKLNALTREPWVRYDWTGQKLRDVSRWTNRFIWRRASFTDYDRSRRTSPTPPDEQKTLFSAEPYP